MHCFAFAVRKAEMNYIQHTLTHSLKMQQQTMMGEAVVDRGLRVKPDTLSARAETGETEALDTALFLFMALLQALLQYKRRKWK